MSNPLIVVGTPCFGGLVSQDYTLSLLNLSNAASQHGFDVAVLMLGNDALITRGRSAIVSRFLDNPATTHLLFVDADITFSVEQVVRMLKFDKDFVAGLYPAKIIDWTQLAQRFGHSKETLDEAGLAYVGALCEGSEAKREQDFATGTYAGTGFQLIKRSVFERMIKAYPETKYKSLHAFPRPSQPSDNLYALFDCMIDKETGVYLSEDYAFCKRWRAIGGEIWLDLKSKLNHSGSYTYHGNAATRYIDGDEMSKPVVAIGVPSGDLVSTDFAMSLAMLCMNPGAQVFLLNSRSSLVPIGRNQCVGGAQVMKATHLLFLDTDVVFPVDTLTRLLAHDKDIVGATYSKRMPPFHPLTVTEGGEHIHITSGLKKVRLLPTGCMLIKLSVFDRLSKPYFTLSTEGDQLRGEDYYFCEKARAAGYEIWCDGDLSNQLGHIGQKVYRIGDVASQS